MTFLADWNDAERVPVKLANKFAVTIATSRTGTPQGVILAVGQITPPTFVGSPDEIRAQLEALDGKRQVFVQGRYLLTREQTQELITLLQAMVSRYDGLAGSEGGAA